jgi:hypothetical protein
VEDLTQLPPLRINFGKRPTKSTQPSEPTPPQPPEPTDTSQGSLAAKYDAENQALSATHRERT